MTGWDLSCAYAPFDPSSKHCRKENEGPKAARRANIRGSVGKGYFGCAKNCRFYKARGIKS